MDLKHILKYLKIESSLISVAHVTDIFIFTRINGWWVLSVVFVYISYDDINTATGQLGQAQSTSTIKFNVKHNS